MYNNDTLLLYSRDMAMHVFLGKDEPISPFSTEQLVILYFLLLMVGFLYFCVMEKKITILILVIPIKFMFFSFVKIFFYYMYLMYHPGIIEPFKVIIWLLPWTCTYYFANEPLLRLKFANMSFDYASIIFLLYLRYGNSYWELSLHANRNIIFFLLITMVLISMLLYQSCIFFDKKKHCELPSDKIFIYFLGLLFLILAYFSHLDTLLLCKDLEKIFSTFLNLFGWTLVIFFSISWEIIKTLLENFPVFWNNFFISFWEIIKAYLNNLYNFFWEIIKTLLKNFNNFCNFIWEIIKTFLKIFSVFWNNLYNFFWEIIKTLLKNFNNFYNFIWEIIKTFLKNFSVFWNNFCNFMSNFSSIFKSQFMFMGGESPKLSDTSNKSINEQIKDILKRNYSLMKSNFGELFTPTSSTTKEKIEVSLRVKDRYLSHPKMTINSSDMNQIDSKKGSSNPSSYFYKDNSPNPSPVSRTIVGNKYVFHPGLHSPKMDSFTKTGYQVAGKNITNTNLLSFSIIKYLQDFHGSPEFTISSWGDKSILSNVKSGWVTPKDADCIYDQIRVIGVCEMRIFYAPDGNYTMEAQDKNGVRFYANIKDNKGVITFEE